ncbi:MAG: tetratricopeptide repeat protein [Oceanipulchritudo sp.]
MTGSKSCVSTFRRWLMGLATMVLIPALLLGVLELVLRAAGFGHRTGYYVAAELEGIEYRVPNPYFSHRFFPPALAREPYPQRIPAEKPEGTFRIFLFGESAAYGDPDPAYGVGRQLEVLLEERYPGTDFEVVCTAMTAINSHAILPIARECAGLDGDLWIVYMGNNEMVGAYGAGTVFSSRAPPLWLVRTMLGVKATRIGQLMEALVGGIQGKGGAPAEWDGINMFRRHLIHEDDPGRLTAYRNFQGNLEGILRAGKEAGVPVLLSTVGSNLRDCAPFASLYSEGLKAEPIREWKSHYREGTGLEERGAQGEALAAYREAAAIDAHHAELHFRMGRCWLSLGQADAARESFVRARDLDALAVRADTRINGIIREAAGKCDGAGVTLVDSVAALAAESADGFPGRDLFFEHVHFTLAGNYRLARILAAQVASRLPPGMVGKDPGEWVDAETVHRALAVTLWDRHRLWHNMEQRLSRAPHTDQLTNAGNIAWCTARAQAVIARIGKDTPAEDRRLYEEAIHERPDDILLRQRFAQYLEAMGHREEAIRELQRVCELIPGLEWPHYQLGELYTRAGRHAEAAECYEQALAIRGDFPEAREALDKARR